MLYRMDATSVVSCQFYPPLHKPRERYAICPVQAIVLKYDQFVDAELIDEMPYWIDDFSV